MQKTIFDGKLEVTIPVPVKIPLTKDDIFNWLNDCEDPETLKYLGNAALRFAAARKVKEDDDFRSRA